MILFLKAPMAEHASPAQIEAGNYRKSHIRFQGMAIAIENPAGSVRKWGDPNGKHGQTRMKCDYGYFKGSQGVDKDHVDCYVGPNPNATHAYIIHQRQAGNWKAYDEDKVMLGFDSLEDARQAYLAHYDDPRFLGPITSMGMDEFKRKCRTTQHKPGMIKSRILFLRTAQ